MIEIIPQKPDKISVHDIGYIIFGVAAFFKYSRQFLNIGNGIQIVRALFGSESAIKIAAHANMPRISCQLANVVDIAGHNFQSNIFLIEVLILHGSSRGPSSRHPA